VNLSIAGAPQPVNGFRQGTPVGAGPRDNLPILDGYLFASENTAPPSLANPTVTLSGISGVTAGSAVTLTVYSIGDVDDQIAPVTFSDGIQSFTSGSTSPSSPFVTFNFTASGSDTFQIFADNSANDSLFAAINGFSISVDPAPVARKVDSPDSSTLRLVIGSQGKMQLLFCFDPPLGSKLGVAQRPSSPSGHSGWPTGRASPVQVNALLFGILGT